MRCRTARGTRESDCTPFDPKPTPGYEAWRWTVRSLREALATRGWRATDRNNLPLVVDPSSNLAVIVTSGDTGTGLTDGEPKTRYPKGPQTRRCIRVNRKQLLLWDSDGQDLVPTPNEDEMTTWMLVVCAAPILDPQSRQVVGTQARCELSLPAAIDEEGYVDEWAERIILPTVRIESEGTDPITAAEAFDEVEVDVAWRNR